MPRIVAVPSPDSACAPRGGFDAVVVVGHEPTKTNVKALREPLKALASADAAAGGAVNFVPAGGVAGGRLVVAPTGPVGRDYDDVRRYAEAAGRGLCRARDAGAKNVLLLVQAPPRGSAIKHAAAIARDRRGRQPVAAARGA